MKAVHKLLMMISEGKIEKEELMFELLNFISEEDAQKLYDNLVEYLEE